MYAVKLTEVSLNFKQHGRACLIVAAVIFVCCLLGIFTRPIAYFAYFWPANAVLIGLFLRFKPLRNVGGWLGAFIGYMSADLVTGNHLELTLALTIANFMTVGVSLFFIHYLQIDYRAYNKGLNFLYLFLVCAFLGCFSSAIFVIAVVPYMPDTLFVDVLPLLSVLISVACTHLFFGPGALLFPLAGLIWAALSYNLFYVSIINSLVCFVTYHSLTTYYISRTADNFLATSISVRIGLCMLMIAPLLLCIVSRNRHDLYKEVLYLANHDPLTHVGNRRFFFTQTENLLKKNLVKSMSIIVLDIDHFKKMNDQYGHYIGDVLLQSFATTVKSNLREQDLFARMGGEEFVVVLNNTTEIESQIIAERICRAVATSKTQVAHAVLSMTVSLGVVHQVLPTKNSLQSLLNRADRALYQAKTLGRNQVQLAS
ncbi:MULTISPECIES: GGDEF domain-containing protein [Acinetobacter]|uniref:GGDEF domain-containing protein n=1 Tax=Acinetobacter TaxID=469 RepID=UPI000738C56D|nr:MULTISPECIES: GGDEF domain-containing protein [Acinetobacter]AXF45614.1 GGDEF domain-containing protein [Acinetobacter johnsonii]KUG38868.1 response regulator [Acinetobacter johnsonii]MDH1278849.1 GGDEF domain-containing protein [Acinetobacter johnsonii]MDH1714531.1 GGDEF domain-containing protein [Acinetobacter johnsonii]MDQ8973377.1 GGDEF domain-containing protein [Acinetobacter johnsonii]